MNLHQILSILDLIKQAGGAEFLKKFLHPEYSFFDYKFENFNPLELDKLNILKKPIENKNKMKNSQRCIRISLDSLDAYSEKENRRVGEWNNKLVDTLLMEIIASIKKRNFEDADKKLRETIHALATNALNQW